MAKGKKTSGKNPGKRTALMHGLKRFGFSKPDVAEIVDSLTSALPGRGKGKKGNKTKKGKK